MWVAWAHPDGRTREPGRDLGEEYSRHRERQVQRRRRNKLGTQEGLQKGRVPGASWKTAERGKEGAEGSETSSRVTKGRQGTSAHRDCTCKTEIP